MDVETHDPFGSRCPSMIDVAMLGFSFLMIAWVIISR